MDPACALNSKPIGVFLDSLKMAEKVRAESDVQKRIPRGESGRNMSWNCKLSLRRGGRSATA